MSRTQFAAPCFPRRRREARRSARCARRAAHADDSIMRTNSSSGRTWWLNSYENGQSLELRKGHDNDYRPHDRLPGLNRPENQSACLCSRWVQGPMTRGHRRSGYDSETVNECTAGSSPVTASSSTFSTSESRGRESLLDAAERLVAERGLYGVRARHVVQAAGHKNNSAVAYHFGSLQALFEAAQRRNSERVRLERAALLARTVDRGEYDLKAMLEAYLRPLVAELRRHRPSYRARFDEQWLAARAPNESGCDASTTQHPSGDATARSSTLLRDIASSLTHLDPNSRDLRVALMVRYVVAALAEWERDGGTAQGLNVLERELMSTALAMLSAA